MTAILFMGLFMICIVAPFYFSFQMVYAKINEVIKEPGQVNEAINAVSKQVQEWTGMDLLDKDTTAEIGNKAAGFIPVILNSSIMMVGNLLMILFLAYFMFTKGRELEESVRKFIPLNPSNVDELADETVNMVRANALGVPLMSLIQGICAIAGYWIFGVKDYVLLGLVTGLFSFFPIVGTAVIWLPVVIYLFAAGDSGKAIGLGIYSLVVVGNVDYLARVTFLKKIGNVNPVTTILGLIAGLKLFGFWGFIFGPLLISLLFLLIRIYKTEFSRYEGR